MRWCCSRAEPRLGGHANTTEAPGLKGPVPVDTGFIVYNEPNYPNFTAMLDTWGWRPSGRHGRYRSAWTTGRFEYSSFGMSGMFAQKRNIFSARFWAMLRDVTRF